jgi:hypothetical protein
MYEHRLIVLRERDLRMMIIRAIRQHEAGLARTIVEAVDPLLLARWRATVTRPHERGTTVQSWLWAAPAKHSSRQIEEVIERIELLTALGVDRHLTDFPDAILRRYARRLAARAPAVAARVAEPVRTIEIACFLRYCLLTQCRWVESSAKRSMGRIANAPSPPPRWRRRWTCEAPCAKEQCGSNTAWRSAAARRFSFRSANAKRAAVRTIDDYHYRQSRAHSLSPWPSAPKRRSARWHRTPPPAYCVSMMSCI